MNLLCCLKGRKREEKVRHVVEGKDHKIEKRDAIGGNLSVYEPNQMT